jgi:hypothetical protein
MIYCVTLMRGIERLTAGRLWLAEFARVFRPGDLVFAEAIAEYRKQVTK